ncbi:hypothetical protein [Paenibacillus sp. FSL L8-0709]|uniref:hypothetical protein n=1 Tax=Paenibacillus sp. FSL L8-0709 TaxID=2975312 RepID=UPI0030F4E27C
MKLQVELWAEKVKPFGEEAEYLFKESVLCYKVGAYTSAFLMSYLAFRTAVRHRILKCTYRPSKYNNEQMWNFNICDPLKTDDSWEDALDKILEANHENIKAIIYFENREKALTDLKYWRNIRNACAHAKKATIDSSTVESFWNYLRDNMGKFYVLGGKEYLVEKMVDYYKYHKVDAQIYGERNLLIHDIKVVYADPSEFFQTFFIKLLEEADRSYIRLDANNMDFWKDFIDTDYEEIQNGIVKELMTSEVNFNSFYSKFPKILELAMSINSRFSRDILSDWLKDVVTWAIESNQGFWNMICSALERNKDSLNIEDITRKIDLELIEGVSFSNGQLLVLDNCMFFNKSILTSGKYFFEMDYTSILQNSGRRENEVLPWFKYVQWDIQLLSKLNTAMYELKQLIQRQEGKPYGQKERHRKTLFEEIIQNNKEKIIEQLLPEQLESFEHIKEVLERI